MLEHKFIIDSLDVVQAVKAYYGRDSKLNINTGVGNPVKIAGRGSKGRIAPNTLKEQMAMHQVKSDPLNGAVNLSKLKKTIIIQDSRWKASEVWVKMSNNVNGVEIHFNYNTITGEFDDFKFKN